jgi:hypothetical protein
MKLLELFDKSAPYKWKSFHGMPAAIFDVEEIPYLVAFLPYNTNFLPFSKSELPRKYDTVMGALTANYKQGDLVSGNYLLGTGNEFLVFSTVLKIFEEYLHRDKPEAFAVAALVEEGRPAVYAKMMKRVSKRMEASGYVFAEEETMQNTPMGAMHAFYMLRQDLT